MSQKQKKPVETKAMPEKEFEDKIGASWWQLMEIAQDEFDSFNPDDWTGFGLMNSHIYRAKLLRLMYKAKLSSEEMFYVVAMSTAIKNKQRIERAMVKFANSSWYEKVYKFYKDHIVQYTADLVRQPDKFAVVHIPSSMPSMAMVAWCLQTKEPNANKATQNMWFCQLDVDSALKAEQKDWERDLWDNKIKKGSSAFTGEGFNEEWWGTKASDTYKLLLPVKSKGVVTYVELETSKMDRAGLTTYIQRVLSIKSE